MNGVVVDKLAGQYQDKLGSSYRPITHMYPSTPAVLEINGDNNTNQHQTSPHHHQSIHRTAICAITINSSMEMPKPWFEKNRYVREVLLVKICNDLLPTATILQKWKMASTQQLLSTM